MNAIPNLEEENNPRLICRQNHPMSKAWPLSEWLLFGHQSTKGARENLRGVVAYVFVCYITVGEFERKSHNYFLFHTIALKKGIQTIVWIKKTNKSTKKMIINKLINK